MPQRKQSKVETREMLPSSGKSQVLGALTNAPLLGYADLSLPFVLETDASVHRLGAVLTNGAACTKPLHQLYRLNLHPFIPADLLSYV